MKKNIYSIALIATLAALSACDKSSDQTTTETKPLAEPETNPLASATISNPLMIDRKETLYFSYFDLGLEIDAPTNSELVATINGKALPQQHIDQNGDQTKDGLLVLVDLKAGESISLEINKNSELAANTWPKQTQAEISHKKGGEWQAHAKVEGKQEYIGGTFQNVSSLSPPEHYTDHSNWIRYEGPGIESDKVGYRIYLDWRNGFDIFGKNTADPVLQLVGQDGYESYHHMQDWGMDILKVGSSLGAGGFGVAQDDKVELINEVANHRATIIENGPIFSSLSIDYSGWQSTANGEMNLRALVSMQAGSRLAHSIVTPERHTENFAIGVVKHPDTDFIQGPTDIAGDNWTYIASWGKQSLNDDMLGMAVFFKKRELDKVLNDESSWAVQMRGEAGVLDYYFAAYWQGEHGGKGVATKAEFENWLNEEAKKLTYQPRVNLTTAATQAALSFPVTAESALTWSIRLADSELKRKALDYAYDGWDYFRQRKPKFEYDIVGLLPMAMHELAKESGDENHRQLIHKVTASYIENDGSLLRYKLENYNIDSVAPGRAVLRLYQDDAQEKFKVAATTLRKQLHGHPRTSEGAFWHKKRYPWQLWLDGVYMGMPFLAEYSLMFENGESLEEVVKEFEITRKYLHDPETGLYYHAWDEKKEQIWADKKSGLSHYFWGRGVGWLAMALVDTLDYLPSDKVSLRQPLIEMTQELASALIKHQDKDTHTWWQILDMPGKVGNYREASASAMFTYFLAKAVNKGYLDDAYKQEAQRAYEGLLNNFVLVHANGEISYTQNCLVAGLGYGRDGSYDYYTSERIVSNDPKATVPFILAGIEIYRMLSESSLSDSNLTN